MSARPLKLLVQLLKNRINDTVEIQQSFISQSTDEPIESIRAALDKRFSDDADYVASILKEWGISEEEQQKLQASDVGIITQKRTIDLEKLDAAYALIHNSSINNAGRGSFGDYTSER